MASVTVDQAGRLARLVLDCRESILRANRLGMEQGHCVMVGLLAHIDDAATLLAEIDGVAAQMTVAEFIARLDKAAPEFIRANFPEIESLIEPACERIAQAVGAIKPKDNP